jgi:hypothetical protein
LEILDNSRLVCGRDVGTGVVKGVRTDGSVHQEKPPQLSEDNLVISALNEEKRSIRAPQSATIGDALSGDNISLIFYETIR